MEKIDIEKMSNIDLSQDSVKSISDKCNELKSLRKQIEDEEDKLSTLKNKLKAVRNYHLICSVCTSQIKRK
jgi:predicted RNase H-like nuclease (RuvC/YqgF family)